MQSLAESDPAPDDAAATDRPARQPSGVLRAATFACDATPPIGSPLGMGLVPPTLGVTDRLSARGVVLLGSGDPIVLCAVDWLGIAGSGHRAWQTALAEAAGTSPGRVAVHTLHQHDAPGSDPDAEDVMIAAGMPGRGYDADFIDSVLMRARAAVRAALGHPQTLTHVGTGAAEVIRVASNRRVLGADGLVAHFRASSESDPAVRAAAEGVIDPMAKAITLWSDDRMIAALTFYATHPQSHYRERLVSSDFVGLGRDHVQQAHPEALHVHFCGAAGNIAAGKYNDGTSAQRDTLARRVADGLDAAVIESGLNRTSVGPADLSWRSASVRLPLSPILQDGGADRRFAADPTFWTAASVAWARRVEAGDSVGIASLSLGSARTLHLPGELFVEYQLAAAAAVPDGFVATAGYGDYGPAYVGTEIAYPQGGYETGPASRVAPETERVLFPAICSLLEVDPSKAPRPSDLTDTAPRSAESSRP